MIEVIANLLILASSIPVGFFLAWLCNDELLKDRKYFLAMIYLSLTAALFGVLFFSFSRAMILSLVYFAAVLLVMAFKAGRKHKN